MLDSGDSAPSSGGRMNLPRSAATTFRQNGANIAHLAGEMSLEPILVKRQQAAVAAHNAEAVHVRVAETAPVDELNAQFERGLGLTDELVFVDVERLIELPDLRNRGFADANRADFVGFDQADAEIAEQHLGHGGRGHPSGRAAADDDNVLYGVLSHAGIQL